MSATAEERTKLLNKLEEAAKKFNEEVDKKDEPREKKWKKRTKASTSSARLNIITR